MAQKEKTVLNVARREVVGKKVGQLRRTGVTPANIYGRNVDSVAVEIPTEDLRQLFKRYGRNEIIYVQIDGEERPTFVREIQRNPVTDQVLHVDLMQISLTDKVKIDVPIHLVGLSPAVDTFGGVLTHQLNAISVEALPTAVPSSVEVDVSVLTELEQALHVSDIVAPEGVVILDDPEAVVARVATPAAERAEEMAEAEEAAAEEAVPEGEAAAASTEASEEE
jgi:large subunit ribosomal protein L25